jgi:vancomycin resistance protein YoaR
MNDNVATAPTLPGTISKAESTLWTWPRITLATLLVLSVIALGTLLGIYESWNKSGKLAPGFIVQGENLGGLSQAQAKARLEKKFGRLFLNLETPERPYKLALRQLGGQVLVDQSVEQVYWYGRSENLFANAWTYWTTRENEQRRFLPVKWNKDMLRKTMWTVARNYHRAPRDAKLEVTTSGIQIIPDESGRAMNVGATCKTLQAHYFPGKPAVQVTTRTIAPRLAAADLSGRDVMFAKYTTYFDSGLEGRTQNIHLAAQAINGKVLMPGESFSFNNSTGERTGDKGYRIAHIFIHKPGKSEAEVVDGRGGGTCQVSSTLYNAVRKTNNKTDGRLAILERNTHSLPVTYVPSGLDATVAWPDKDFKFRNKFAHPVYIRTEISGAHITISIWGRVPDNVSDIVSTTDKQASTSDSIPST